MPPKVKITKEDIIESAERLVREKGADALNARSIANALSCSTQPIFSNFASMEDLKAELLNDARQKYEDFFKIECSSGKYPTYKSSGMAYIRFARKEKELFKLLYMRSRTDSEKNDDFSDYEHIINEIVSATGFSYERAKHFHLENWIFVHGIAVMVATNYIDFNEDIISGLVTDVYNGLLLKYKEETYE